MLALAAVGWGTYQKVDWQTYKPVVLLIREADGTDRYALPALNELLRRQRTGLLSKTHVSSVIEAGLRLQGDGARPWTPGWGDFIETARLDGTISDAQWKKYAEQAASTDWLSIHVRPKLSNDESAAYRISGRRARVGNRSTLYAYVQRGGFVIDGTETPSPFRLGSGSGALAWNGGHSSTSASQELNAALQNLLPGHHRGYQRLRVRVTDSPPPAPRMRFSTTRVAATSAPRDGEAMKNRQAEMNEMRKKYNAERAAYADAYKARADGTDGSPTYADVELHLPIKFELVPPGHATMTPTTNPDTRRRVQKLLSAEPAVLSGRFVSVTVKCADTPPVHLAFDAYIRQNDVELRAGRVTFATDRRREQEAPLTVVFTNDNRVSPGMIDILLRPIADTEQIHNPDITTYYAGEIVLTNVPVTDPIREHMDSARRRMEQSATQPR